jgi:hypothetical protein
MTGPLPSKPPTGVESDLAVANTLQHGSFLRDEFASRKSRCESAPGQTLGRTVNYDLMFAGVGLLSSGRRDSIAFSASERSANMGTTSRPTTYLTIEELQEMAAAKFEEAAALLPGPEQQEILKKAYGYKSLADMKAWLCSDLRPPT